MREVRPPPPAVGPHILILPSGRREIPILLLRLRRTGSNLAIAIPTLARRTSRVRTASWPPTRSRSRATTSHIRRAAERRYAGEPNRVEGATEAGKW
jgi:hypothetical protein